MKRSVFLTTLIFQTFTDSALATEPLPVANTYECVGELIDHSRNTVYFTTTSRNGQATLAIKNEHETLMPRNAMTKLRSVQIKDGTTIEVEANDPSILGANINYSLTVPVVYLEKKYESFDDVRAVLVTKISGPSGPLAGPSADLNAEILSCHAHYTDY